MKILKNQSKNTQEDKGDLESDGKKIALYDIDKTSYRDFLLLDLVRYQYKTDILPESMLLAIEKDIESYSKQELTYEEMARNVLEYWLRGLKGKTLEEVVNNTKNFFQTEGKKFLPFVQESIDLLKPTHDTYFVTAEPQFVAQEVTNIHQATGYFSTIFELKDGIFTGNVSSSLASKEKKGDVVRDLLKNHTYEKSFSFGDSDNDIEMLEGVEYPICVNPNPALTKVALEKGWSIKRPDEVILFINAALTKS